MERNQLIIVIFVVIIAVIGVVGAASLLMAPQYQEYSDENIKVEIPTNAEFMRSESGNGSVAILNYNSTDPKLGITILAVNSSSSSAEEDFANAKKELKNIAVNKLDNSEHDYDGNVYR
ncbi:MAG: hypothetical protein LBM26_00515, partial [Methanobrevibacter sp.]|nr:hypothetical protein [Methanobrevibacter sp.]